MKLANNGKANSLWTCRQKTGNVSIPISTKDRLTSLLRRMGLKYSRWYRTPDKLHKFFSNVSPLCWWCNKEAGSLFHIWWTCLDIQPFWMEVHCLISNITTYTPVQYLLHPTSLPQARYQKFLLHLISAAKMCIPLQWKEKTPPTVTEWTQRVIEIAEMEDLGYQVRETPSKFYKVWACWVHFVYSGVLSQVPH